MAQGSARFLLEFQATGDTEVINALQRISAEGQATASDLGELDTGLSQLEGTLSGYGSAAEGAVGPTEELGTATEEMTGTLTDVTGEADAAATGITTFGEGTEEAATKTEGFGKSIGTMSGSIAAIGGTIGSAISALFRYQDAQLRVQTAQTRAAKSAETYRKAEQGIDQILAKATSNTANIAAARDRLSQAQDRLNQLQNAGITSGQEYEAAVAEVAAAQASLAQEAQGTGVDMAKLADAMNKSSNASAASATANNRLEKALRDQKRTVLDTAFGFAGLAGSITQTVAGFGTWGPAMKGVKSGLVDLVTWAGRGGLALGGIGTAITGTVLPAIGGMILALAAGLAAYEAYRGVPKIFDFINAAIEGNTKKMIDSQLQVLELMKNIQSLSPIGTATIPLIDKMIAKAKELSAQRKITIDTVEQEKSAESGLLQILKLLPQGVKDYINSFAGIELIPPTTDKVTTSTEKATAAVGQHATAANELSNAVGAGVGVQEEMMGVTKGLTSSMEKGKTVEEAFADVNSVVLNPAVRETVKSVTDAGRAILMSFIPPIQQATNVMSIMGHTVQELGNGWRIMDGTLMKGAQSVDTTTKNLQTGELAVQKQAKSLQYLNGITGTWTNETTAAGEAQKTLAENLSASEKEVLALSDETINEKNAFLDADTAVGAHNKTLQANRKEMLDTITALQDSGNQFYAEQNAILATTVALEESNQALRDAQAVAADAGAQQNLLTAAINNEKVAVLEEAQALDARAAIAANAEIQQGKLANAYQEGVVSIQEWNAAIKTSNAEAAGARAELEKLAAAFPEIGDTAAYTTEQLQHMVGVMSGSAEELQKVFDDMQSAFDSFAGSLTLDEEDLRSSIKDAFEGVPEWIQDAMPKDIKTDIVIRADMQQNAKIMVEALGAAITSRLSKGTPLGDVREFGANLVDQIREGIAPGAEEIWEPIISVLQDMPTVDTPQAWVEWWARLQTAAEGAGIPVETFNGILANTPGAAEGAAGSVDTLTGAVNPMNAAIQAAGASLTQFSTYLSEFFSSLGGVISGSSPMVNPLAPMISAMVASLGQLKTIVTTEMGAITTSLGTAANNALTAATGFTSAFNTISTSVLTLRNNVLAAGQGITTGLGAAANSARTFATAATTAFNAVSKAALTTRNNVNAMSSGMSSALGSAASKAKSFASATTSAFNAVGRSALTNRNNVNQLRSAINSLKSKSITIHVGLSGPGVAYLQHGFHGVVDKPMLFIAGEAGPERVDVTPGVGGGSGGGTIHRTVAVASGGGGGGSRPLNITVIGELNGKELIRFTRRGIMEEASGAM